MKILRLVLMVALFAAPAMNATAATKSSKPVKPWVTIPFVNYGNIYDWRAVDHKAILIASSRKQWYKATFFSPCWNLDNALAVGFVTNPPGTLDKFSSIIVDGRQCQFKSLEKIPAPGHDSGKANKAS